ncbi:ABC transporter ATP-binding protein [Microbaculum marinum]|uniref:ABC transporter ATP-binding protein n=1 Tax=Microbaculum marinum TaxID=1764581 RepID=A0AAW9RTV1_9HYPH
MTAAEATLAPLLQVRDVTVRYGAITAVHGLSLHVDAGEIVAIVGPNGAGKTSLLSSIAGLVRPQAGAILLRDVTLETVGLENVVRHGIALVPEGRNIFASLTVLENLQLGATIRRDAAVRSDLQAFFESFPILGERRNQPAGLLSGGEQQMLAIARALMSRPTLLMLDEPSLGLAPKIVEQVYAELERIRDGGVTILVVEQNAARAFAVADRAYVMRHGRLALAGTPDELRAHADFDAAYFGVSMAEAAPPEAAGRP